MLDNRQRTIGALPGKIPLALLCRMDGMERNGEIAALKLRLGVDVPTAAAEQPADQTPYGCDRNDRPEGDDGHEERKIDPMGLLAAGQKERKR
jgi:hypothetical protein